MSAGEGIYRRLSVRLWSDEKVRRLSALKPSGQALWLYLLTGPHTGPIPGVFVAGRAALSEALEWEIEDFDACLAELTAQGLVCFDRPSRLWFIPNAVKHNPPASPNVVRGWRNAWTLLPEGQMREEVGEALMLALEASSKPCAEALREVFGKASSKPSPDPSPNQEAGIRKQETGSSIQEQEQQEATSRGRGKAPTAAAAASTRGSRLPVDWVLPKAWGEWALAEFPAWTADKVRTEAAKFADHWHAKAGRDATKADWHAAWRKWTRNAEEFAPKAPRSTAGMNGSQLRADSLAKAERVRQMGGFDKDARDAEARRLLGFAPLPPAAPAIAEATNEQF